MSSPRSGARRAGSSLVAAAVALAGSAVLLTPGTSLASSHREAPLTSANPLIDNTDVYAFDSPDKPGTTTLIADWIPFEEPAGGPNFYPFGANGYRYQIKVDNNGDGKPDITYRWTFTNHDARKSTFLYNDGPVKSFDDATLLFKQTYTLVAINAAGTSTTLVTDGKVAPTDVGVASMPDYGALRNEALSPTSDGGTSFAGQADDPFFLDLRVFDLLYGTNLKEAGSDTLSGYNVNTIALQVPTANLLKGGDGSGIIGVWSTTEQQSLTLSPGKATPGGPYVQVSRLGSPLVNEVVIPAYLKDAFNSLTPDKDHTVTAAVDAVTNPEVPLLIQKIYGLPAPKAPRTDLVAAFLTGIKGLNQPPKVLPAEMLRLNTKTPVTADPNRLGVLAGDKQGFPNGRRLTDDVVDIELQALEGAIITGKIVPALAKGDGVNTNDEPFGDTFPYVALPHTGSNTASRGTSVSANSVAAGPVTSGTAPSGGVGTGLGGTAGSDHALPITLGLIAIALAGSGVYLRRRDLHRS